MLYIDICVSAVMPRRQGKRTRKRVTVKIEAVQGLSRDRTEQPRLTEQAQPPSADEILIKQEIEHLGDGHQGTGPYFTLVI